MLDADTKLRKAYYNVIRGNVTIEGSEIPIVDEKLDTQLTEHDIYIKLSAQLGQQQNNKSYFARLIDINVEIVQRTKSVGSKLIIDDVANQIMQLLFPTKNTTALSIDAPLKLSFARYQSSNTSSLIQIETGFLIIKTVVFTNRVYQPE